MLYPYTLIVPWQNSVFKSLEISLEGKVICQVEKEGIVVDPLEVTEVCHTGCSIKKKLQIRKWMSSVCCSHLKMALSGLYLSCNEKCLCGLPGTKFPNCWKTSLPIRLLSRQQRSSWCSVWSCLQLACTYEHILHTGVRMKGCKATLDRLHFEHFKEMGKTWMLWKGGG